MTGRGHNAEITSTEREKRGLCFSELTKGLSRQASGLNADRLTGTPPVWNLRIIQKFVKRAPCTHVHAATKTTENFEAMTEGTG